MPVLYAFGHGLSYASFSYGPLAAGPAPAAADDDDDSSASGGGCERRRHRPVLRVTLNVTNTGSMASGHAVLLMLSFSGPPPPQQHAWLCRWLPGGGVLGPAGAPQAVPLDLPCTPASASAGGCPGEPEVPLQELAGFERVQGLAPGETAAVSFDLTARSFQPFSPLAEGDLATTTPSSSGGSSRSGSRRQGGCAPPPRPYCGTYVLRASGGSELALQLGGPASSGALSTF